MDDFNPRFDHHQKMMSKGFKFFWVFWFFCLVLGLALTGGVIFVVIHFLAKVW